MHASFYEKDIIVPGSKSWAARLLILEAIADTSLIFHNFPRCEDIINLHDALRAIKEGAEVVNVGESGTAMRFIMAYAATLPGKTTVVTGSQRLLDRPMQPLVDVLRELRANIEIAPDAIKITGTSMEGGSIRIDGTVSSQFISALMLISPTMANGLTIQIDGNAVSKPYIELTACVMRLAGLEVSFEEGYIKVSPGQISLPSEITIPTDWSSASYIYEAVSMSTRRMMVFIPELVCGTCQADERCMELFSPWVKSTPIFGGMRLQRVDAKNLPERVEMDMSATPDIVPTMAVAYAMKGVRFKFSGIGNLKYKESNRIAAIVEGLRILGIKALGGKDWIKWGGGIDYSSLLPKIDAHGDHRIAMAFAAASGVIPIEIDGAESVAKSWPGFFNEIQKLKC